MTPEGRMDPLQQQALTLADKCERASDTLNACGNDYSDVLLDAAIVLRRLASPVPSPSADAEDQRDAAESVRNAEVCSVCGNYKPVGAPCNFVHPSADARVDCPLCGVTVQQVASASLGLALWQHVNWVCAKRPSADARATLEQKALKLANAIDAWAVNEKGGYDQAIALVCEASDLLRALAALPPHEGETPQGKVPQGFREVAPGHYEALHNHSIFAPEGETPQPERVEPACMHGTALDVHCCNCHSGFIFDVNHECPPMPNADVLNDLFDAIEQQGSRFTQQQSRLAMALIIGWADDPHLMAILRALAHRAAPPETPQPAAQPSGWRDIAKCPRCGWRSTDGQSYERSEDLPPVVQTRPED